MKEQTALDKALDICVWNDLGKLKADPRVSRCKAMTKGGTRCERSAAYPTEHRQHWCRTHYLKLLDLEAKGPCPPSRF